MKKIIATLFALGLAAASAFADQVMHALDFSIPIENRTYSLDGDIGDYDDKIDTSAVGFNFNYDRMAVGDSGFSFIFGLGMGYEKLSFDDYVDFNNYDMKIKLGWGGSPIHGDNMLLSIHGYTGFDITAGAGSKSGTDWIFADFGMPIGVDAVFAIKLSGSFGLTAGLDIGTNLFKVGGLFGEYKYEYEEYHSGYYSGYYTTETETKSSSDFVSCVFNGFSITPKIGICWILDD